MRHALKRFPYERQLDCGLIFLSEEFNWNLGGVNVVRTLLNGKE